MANWKRSGKNRASWRCRGNFAMVPLNVGVTQEYGSAIIGNKGSPRVLRLWISDTRSRP